LLLASLLLAACSPPQPERPSLLSQDLTQSQEPGDRVLEGKWEADSEGAVFRDRASGTEYSVIPPNDHDIGLLPATDRQRMHGPDEGVWYECLNVKLVAKILDSSDPRARIGPTIILRKALSVEVVPPPEGSYGRCIDL
jgi:hypothetical protein